MMQDVIELIQKVGFPITVAVILLFRYDKRLLEMYKVLEKIARRMDALVLLAKGEEVLEDEIDD